MARMWKRAAAVWAAILFFIIIGSRYRADADLFVHMLVLVLLVVATVYAVAVMIRKRRYFSGYPPRFMRFALDELEPKGARGNTTAAEKHLR